MSRRLGLSRSIPLAVLAITGGALLISVNGAANTNDGCDEGRAWPFESFSCHIYQELGSRAQLAEDVLVTSLPVSQEQAAQVALERNLGARLLEARLVYVWSDEGDYKSDRQLVWAVSLEMPNGTYMSTGALYLAELQHIRPDGDSRPLSLAEQEALQQAVEARVEDMRALLTEEYHLDFVDPYTGAWLGGAEGAG